ncbi:3D domain-containing protein [Ammoniphilus resinae]|uniref:3D (Asp-Asp-Asp) domain-containing protein n=1 Tax=Ammoniphilus resinae TaxID=861532 RepID=A0ABS4GWU2_9BACL|nr:3D domain-containing protein [Ammoniphilus resinae]MBP1934738.1 3D (Asp-Asp-Asp) domain-containing protein [Ammoniphilus resinae]
MRKVKRKSVFFMSNAVIALLVVSGTTAASAMQVEQAPVSQVATSNSEADFTAEKVLTMAASAYLMQGARAANGTLIGKGIVAVDPDVIPLGTKLYIEGYGYAVASDIGGGVKGNRIDVHFDNQKEVEQFGRRTVKVYIIQ